VANFLISTMPASGHVNPALPLAAELVRRDHQVWWHTATAYADQVAAAGAHLVPFVHTLDFEQLPVEPDPGDKGMAAGVTALRKLFIDRMPGQYQDYQAITTQFPADVVLADLCCLGAGALHEAGGPVYATLGINPLVTPDPEIPRWGKGAPPATSPARRLGNRLDHLLGRVLFMRKPTALLNQARAGIGLPPLPPGSNLGDFLRSPLLHLMPTTEAFEYPRKHLPPQVHFVGPLLPPAPNGYLLPRWWTDLQEHPVVHVTQGTVTTDTTALTTPTIQALADDDLFVVVTCPDPEALGPLPCNVRAAGFIPHRLLLPRVAVMVTNAGYNGVLTALAHGVPLVCAGREMDRADVSARVAWAGAGIDLQTDTPTADQIGTAVRTILRQRSYRDNARRIQADFATHQPAKEAAALLERLAESRSPVMRATSAARKSRTTPVSS
jgi:UDP:flavonoid glycosyltransferase YjiC (YdhE family)